MNRLLFIRTCRQRQRLFFTTLFAKPVQPQASSIVFKISFQPTRYIRTFIWKGHNEQLSSSSEQNQEVDETEEIYFEEDCLEEVDDVEGGREYRHPDPNRPPKHMIQPDEVVSALEVERAKNIEVVECDNPESPHRFIVIASPYNDRHAQALTETVRRYFCRNYHFGKTNPVKRMETGGWFVLDFHNGVLHIMKKELRERYKLDQVWSEEDEESDKAKESKKSELDLIPPQNEDDQSASHRRSKPIFK